MSSAAINPQVLDFIKRLASEPGFRAQFEQTDDRDEILSKLREAGYSFSFEEFKQTMETLANTSPDALPDELLAGVAGGVGAGEILGGIVRFAGDVVKGAGDSPFFGVDASGVTDWASDQLSKGIKKVVNLFK